MNSDLTLIEAIGLSALLTVCICIIIASIGLIFEKLRSCGILGYHIFISTYYGFAIYGVYVLYAHGTLNYMVGLFLKFINY